MKDFGMPVFMANNYIIPAVQVKFFKVDEKAKYISVFIGAEEPLTTCAVDQLGFGFFPDTPPEEKKSGNIIKPV